MKISVKSLPSKGYNYLVDEFELKPLTYNQIINYSKDIVTEPVMKILHEIEFLLGDIPGYQDFSSFDLKALIFTRKYISATFKNSFKFRYGDQIKTVKVSEIDYKDISPELKNLGSIKLGGYEFEFSIPTIGRFESTARLVTTNYPNLTPEVIMVIASLGDMNVVDQVTQCVLNSTGNDILVLDYLSHILNDTVKDVTVKDEGGEAVINLNDSITDIFQFLQLNAEFNKTESLIPKTV